MAITFVVVVLFTILSGITGAVETVTHNPPAVTETHGPIIASYNHEAATTSLSGYTNATSTASISPTATAIANGTLPACKSIQYDFPAGTAGNATRAAAVKEAYLYAWNAYEEYAFGYDELTPLTKSYTDDWCKTPQKVPISSLASLEALSGGFFLR